jgi:hypothetical protein
MMKSDGGTVNGGYSLWWDDRAASGHTNDIYFLVINGAGDAGSTVNLPNAITEAGWYHIVATYDRTLGANQLVLYINAIKRSNGTYAKTILANALNVTIGTTSVGGGNWFSGYVSQAYIFNRALSEAEVAYLYLHPNCPKRRGCVLSLVQDQIDRPAAGTWRDTSPQMGNNGTITNATTSKYPCIPAGRNALFFPTAARTDRVDCGNGASLNPATTGTITGECWVKMTNYLSGVYVALLDKYTGVTGWQLLLSTTNVYVYSDVGIAITGVTMADLKDGTWKHIVFTHTGGAATGEIYVNGVNKTSTRTARALSNSATSLYVGNRSTFDLSPVGGYIASARIYNRILSPAEVAYNYTHPNNPIRRGRVLDLSQESLFGSYWYDLSGNANNGTITGAQVKNLGQVDGR